MWSRTFDTRRSSSSGMGQRRAGPLLQQAKKCGATCSCESCAQRPEHTHVAPPEVTDVISRTGEQLDVPSRLLARTALGRDFSHVRVHTDARAAASAHSVDALAYTVGRHVVFGPGRYAPRTPAGNALLLHELTHVVQQDGQQDVTQGPIAIGSPDTPHEREASRAGQQGISAVGQAPHGLLLQRQVLPTEGEEAGSVEEAELAGGLTLPDEAHDGDVPVGASSAHEVTEGRVLLAENDPPTRAGSAKPQQRPGAGADPKPAVHQWIKQIDVDLSSQEMTLTWSNGVSEGPYLISSGKGRPNTSDDPCKTQEEKNCTPARSFTVSSKGDKNTKNSHGDRMSWYVGFVDDRGIGIHDSQRVSKGTPLSHGCVRTGDTPAGDALARKVNENSRIGKTVVVITGKAPTKPWKQGVKKPPTPSKRKSTR